MEQIHRVVTILVIIAALSLSSVVTIQMTGSVTSGYNGGNNMTVWDDSDSYAGGPISRYTYPNSFITHGSYCYRLKDENPGENFYDDWHPRFFSNFTNSSGGSITDSMGNCMIRFDQNNDTVFEAWSNMTYNASIDLWEYNRSFTYKGDLDFQVNCSNSTFDSILLTENITISNTVNPCIFAVYTAGGYIPSVTCYEDTACTYDFYKNVTDDDANDVLSYSCTIGCFAGLTVGPVNGIWTVLVTDDSGAGQETIQLEVGDSDSTTSQAWQNITIIAVNDVPTLDTYPTGATEDLEFNASNGASIIFSDEENDIKPMNYSMNITTCYKAPWVNGSWRTNCSLFTWNQTSNTTAEIYNFTPGNSDVGIYTINYTIVDNRSATYSALLNFTVTNVNDAPNITTSNSTNIELNQTDLLYLFFNGTDIENDTLTFNSTTLVWNESNLSYYIHPNPNLFPITTNITGYPDNNSATGIINLTLLNMHVGNYTLNITLLDNGTNPENLSESMLFNLTILNVNDPPELENITDTLPDGVQQKNYIYYFNASDPDSIFGDTIEFNYTFFYCSTPVGIGDCNIETNSTFNLSIINGTRGMLFIHAVRNDTGNYTLNVSVEDSFGAVNWSLFNITIITNDLAAIADIGAQEMTQGDNFTNDFIITDLENDTLDITYRTLYQNLTLRSYTLYYINVSNATYPPFYNLTINLSPVINDHVGNYTIEVNATDNWNRSVVRYINITVWNINDPPQIINFTSCDKSVNYSINLTIYENSDYCFQLNYPDVDLLTPYGDTMTYTFSLVDCDTSGVIPAGGNCSATISIDSSNGTLDFIALDESWQGNYSFNLTVQDGSLETASKIINLSIYGVNDAPVLENIPVELNTTEGDTFYFDLNATDEENNLPLYYNVSYDFCEQINNSNCSIFSVNHTTGIINFTSDYNDVGNYTLNFTVTDAGNSSVGYSNATGYDGMNFSIIQLNHAPYIWTHSCGDCDVNEGNQTGILKWVEDIDNDTVDCYWYLEGDYRGTIANCNTTDPSSWDFPAGYDDSLNYTALNRTLTLIASDGEANSSSNITIQINNVNRAPRFGPDIDSPIEWSQRATLTTENLSTNFHDDFGENLNYTHIGATHVQVTIGDDDRVTFNAGNWYGYDWIIFVANDSGGVQGAYTPRTNQSNNITLFVKYKPKETDPSPVRISYKPKIASLQIIVEELLTIIPGKSSVATAKFYNDGDYKLKDIQLNTSANSTLINLSIVNGTTIDLIEIGENVTKKINVTLGDLLGNKTYLAYIYAFVDSPEFNESATITIKANPSNKTLVLTEMIMVKDMFSENPECMELFGLILDAENALKEGDIEEAKRLTQLAIDNCQDMIDYSNLNTTTHRPTPPTAGPQIFLDPIFVMAFSIALLVLAMLGFYIMSRMRTVT